MREEYGFDHVVTVTVDVGQPEDDIKQAEERAKAFGTEHYTIDAKAEFVKDYCWQAVKANGDYQGYPISTSIARPLIGLKAVEIAKKVGAKAYAHGFTGKGNDQFRLEYVMRTLTPDIDVIAPMREGKHLPGGGTEPWTRSEEIDYCAAHGIDISITKTKIWSVDENVWGRSIEGGHLEEPNYAPPEEIYKWTRSIADAPDQPTLLTIGFENGAPVSLNGETLAPSELAQRVHTLAGENGVGRVDIME
ncbi:MAG: argininosuccinate synthase, partial [Methanobacterium paludis]|nr:argininosuccinate synthase [Methanobacterium paludis]